MHAAVLVVAPLLEQADVAMRAVFQEVTVGAIYICCCWCGGATSMERLDVATGVHVAEQLEQEKTKCWNWWTTVEDEIYNGRSAQLAMEDEIAAAETGGLLLDWLVQRCRAIGAVVLLLVADYEAETGDLLEEGWFDERRW
ncbi:hypothetical protein POTOM_006397 [Populus tomentosa]|uniref:Uncharacterized protein n=1 Tax=Populus tomentosa TaxID=118781 RepID=A0A8X8DFZ6_POPTO|nr:hypothetical protein POTOM_006397 [Populus tomentosa]